MDQRRVQLYLTAKGEAVLAKAPRPLRGVLQQGLQDLPPASLSALQRRLNELIAAMHVSDQEADAKPLSDI
jgi:DNA-binding MarR family transcriptional regulator